MNEENITKLSQATRFVTIGLGLSWFELLGEIWKTGKKIMRGHASEGLYEVLNFETTLELHDKQGKLASVKKREIVRYLQDNIIAYQDEAWGDGEILVNYKCSPGIAVDRYRLGHKTYILISLREVKRKGEEAEYLIEWDIRNGFLVETGFWEMSINHRMKHVSLCIIFPNSRPPRQAVVIERNSRRLSSVPESNHNKLPDGRWQITWEKDSPKLYESYILKWEW